MQFQRNVIEFVIVVVSAACLSAATAGEIQPSGSRATDVGVATVRHGKKPICKLTLFHTGVCQIGKDHVLGRGYTAEQRTPFVIYSFLVEGPNSETALIDLGPKTIDYCNRMFRTHGFFRDLGPGLSTKKRYPDDIVQPHGNVFDQLRTMKLAPTDIDHIVFTHLHADHHGMDDAKNGGAAEDFPNALLHVSSIGWKDNLAKRKDGKWNSYVDYAFADFLVRREQGGKVRFEDSAEIFPGLRTMYLGGHAVCSQAVVVDTAFGTVIIASDEVYLYQLLTDGIVPQIRTSESNYRTAIQRLISLAKREDGILIPLHDPIVWTTHERARANWLKELKPFSDEAIGQYKRRTE